MISSVITSIETLCFSVCPKDGNWYIDMGYDGDPGDLQMVAGADILLEEIYKGHPDHIYSNAGLAGVSLDIYKGDYAGLESDASMDLKKRGYSILYRMNMLESGANYVCPSYESLSNHPVWLCDVTKIVLGEFPEIIYFKPLD